MSYSTLTYRLWAPALVGGEAIAQGVMRLLARSCR